MERGEEAVFAPIDTASDAFGELADDEGRSSSLVLMPRLRAWIAVAKHRRPAQTQECIYNTELIKHTSAAQRQSTKRQQA